MRINGIIFSLIFAIIGIVSLFLCWSDMLASYYGSSITKSIGEILNNFFIKKYPQPVEAILYLLSWYINLAFIFVFFFSIIGIFLGVQIFNNIFEKRKIALVGIVLNSINLIFSLLIAWLLFGLARGM